MCSTPTTPHFYHNVAMLPLFRRLLGVIAIATQAEVRQQVQYLKMDRGVGVCVGDLDPYDRIVSVRDLAMNEGVRTWQRWDNS